MAIPDYQTCMPHLLLLVSNGETISLKDAIESLVKQFDLSDEEQKQLLPSGSQTVSS